MRRDRLSKYHAGALLPWTRPLYGYRVAPDRPRNPCGVTVDPAEAAVVAELFALYLESGMTLGRLAALLDARGVPTPGGRRGWGLPSIRGILRNPTYTGILYAQRTRYRAPAVRRSATYPLGRPHGTATPLPSDAWLRVGHVPSLVEQARFGQVQAKLVRNQRLAPCNNTAHHYLLRALVSCGACGPACTGRTMGGHNRYYVCSGGTDPQRHGPEARCRARYVHVDALDALVWQDLGDLLSEPAHLAAAFARSGRRVAAAGAGGPARDAPAGARRVSSSSSNGSLTRISARCCRSTSTSAAAATWRSARARSRPTRPNSAATRRASANSPASPRRSMPSASAPSAGSPAPPPSSGANWSCCSLITWS